MSEPQTFHEFAVEEIKRFEEATERVKAMFSTTQRPAWCCRVCGYEGNRGPRHYDCEADADCKMVDR